MREIIPGLWHWTARHEHINVEVSSYYLVGERVLIDPMIPPEGLDWFAVHGIPEHVLLTNRHHDRHAWRLRDAFGCSVHCIRNGLHELEGRGPVEAFDFGDELSGGAVVFEVDAICPDETALHLPAHRALACADGVVRWPGGDELAFVPDRFMDEPERTKAGLRKAYRALLHLDFDHLLLAHGDPVVGGGKEALRAFVEGVRQPVCEERGFVQRQPDPDDARSFHATLTDAGRQRLSERVTNDAIIAEVVGIASRHGMS